MQADRQTDKQTSRHTDALIAIHILTSTVAAFFVQQPPKKAKRSRGSLKLLH